MLSTVAEVSDRNRWPNGRCGCPAVRGYADSRLRRPITRAHPCACMAAQLCLTDVSERKGHTGSYRLTSASECILADGDETRRTGQPRTNTKAESARRMARRRLSRRLGGGQRASQSAAASECTARRQPSGCAVRAQWPLADAPRPWVVGSLRTYRAALRPPSSPTA